MLRHRSKIVCGWVGLMCLGIAGSAAGHSDANFLAPENDFIVKWYQPHGEIPVEYWDVEVSPLEGARQSFIREARVFQDESCWGVDVPIDRRAKVRIRSVSSGRVSGWSRSTIVPEPAFALSSLVSVGLLSLLARRRLARRHASSIAD